MKKTSHWKIELGFALLLALFAVIWMRGALLQGRTTFAGDTLVWYYPAFNYFAESVYGGEIPFWNPFAHGGEPFYPVLFQRRLLEPVTLLVLGLGRVFTRDVPILFNWNLVIQLWVTAAGTYFLLRGTARTLISRLLVILLLSFSSFFFVSFRQIGVLSQYMWAPFILIFLFRIFEEKKMGWGNWLALGALLGFSAQSYWFTGPSFLLLFFFLGAALLRREIYQVAEGFWGKLAATIALVAIMNAPNAVLFLERTKFVFPLRMVERTNHAGKPSLQPLQFEGGPEYLTEGINMSYEQIAQTGSFSQVWDFLQTITPGSNEAIHSHSRKYWFGAPSEAYIFIGLIPWFLALWGLIRGRHPLKRITAFITGGFGLLMLGPAGGLHQILYPVFPPAWFMRNTHCLVLFFLTGILYFFVLGLDDVLTNRTRLREKPVWIFGSIALAQIGLVFHFYPVHSHFLWYLGTMIAVGGSLLWLIRRYPRYATWSSLALLAVVFTDLAYSCRLSTYLYDTQVAPRFAKTVSLLSGREISAQYQPDQFPFIGQSMRYLSQLQERPYAFSTPYEDKSLAPVVSFDEARRAKRWNSYHLLQSYFDLIHSDLPSPLLAAMFSIGRPLIQFKTEAQSDKDIATLSVIPLQQGLKTLEDTVFVNLASIQKFSRPDSPSAFQFEPLLVKRNRVSLEVESSKPGWLYWSDGYDKFWTAKVNEVPVPLYRANRNFKAVVIPHGVSRIEFSYFPLRLVVALSLFYALFVAALVGGLWLLKRERTLTRPQLS